jgi:hypothetical protein
MEFLKQEQKTDAAEQVKDEIIKESLRFLNGAKRKHMSAFRKFWYNPNATPQEICDKFGTNAKEVFIASKATEDYIKILDETYKAPEVPYEFTINADGTVTIGEKKEIDLTELPTP